jgi:hypothetical protein
MERHVPKDVRRILDDIRQENDRAVAIVGASLVEHFLERAIEGILSPIRSTKDRERLFSLHGVASSFEAKTLLAFGLRLVGPKTRRDLDMIRKIRNEFAHDMNPIRFDQPKVGQWIAALHARTEMGGSDTDTNRAKFVQELEAVIGGFQLQLEDLEATNDFISF